MGEADVISLLGKALDIVQERLEYLERLNYPTEMELYYGRNYDKKALLNQQTKAIKNLNLLSGAMIEKKVTAENYEFIRSKLFKIFWDRWVETVGLIRVSLLPEEFRPVLKSKGVIDKIEKGFGKKKKKKDDFISIQESMMK